MTKIYKNLTLVLLLSVLVVLLVFVYLFVNFGTLVIKGSQGSTVLLNGVLITKQNLKLRPGSYEVSISSPTTKTYTKNVHISILKTTNITDESVKLDDAVILNQTLRLNTLNYKPSILGLKRFDDNWLVGVIGSLGSASPAAIHLENNEWQIIYYYTPYSVNRLSDAPVDVQNYIAKLKSDYADN